MNGSRAIGIMTPLLLSCATTPAAAQEAERSMARSRPSVVYVGAVDVDPSGRSPAELGFGIDLNGRVDEETEVTALYLRGANPGIMRAFRYGLHESRMFIGVKRRDWTFSTGEIRSDRRAFGAPVVGQGVAVARVDGGIIGSLAVTQPKHLAGGGGGHLVEGTIGLKSRRATVRGFASDVARTAPRTTPVSSIQLPEDDSPLTLQDLAAIGRILPRENRVRAAGVDAHVRAGRHSVTGRAAWIEQRSRSTARHAGAAFEARYVYADPRAAVTATIRRTPRALPNVDLPGNLSSIGATAKVTRRLKTVARAYAAESLAFGRTRPTRTRGGSAGIEYRRRTARVDVLANYREADSGQVRRSRTLSSALRVPIGRATAEGRMELGESEETRRRRISRYRAALYVDLEPAAIVATASYEHYGALPPRVRADVSGSAAWRGIAAEVGAGGGRSELFGDEIAAWANVEVPLPSAMTLQVGVEYDRWLYATSRYLTFAPDPHDVPSPWRITVVLRRTIDVFGRRYN